MRARLFICVAVLLAGTVVGYVLRTPLLHVVVAPLHQRLYYTSPGGFNFLIQPSLAFGFLWAIPVVIFHALRFVAPILPPRRNRLIAIALVSSCLLMAAGISFAYLVSLPAALQFLNEFSTRDVSALISTDTYLSFVVTYLAASALLFQLPLALLLTNTVTPLPPRQLVAHTRWVILIAFAVSAVVTPTQDPLNQMTMAAPVIGLYLASVGLIWLVNRRARTAPRAGWRIQRSQPVRPEADVLLDLRERLLDLSHAKLVAQQHSIARDGRVGRLCEWEERRWGKVRRGLVTFEHNGRHELVRLERD